MPFPARRLLPMAGLVVAAVLGVSACGTGNDSAVSNPSASSTSSESPSLSSTDLPIQVTPTEPPKLPTDTPKAVTLTGTLVGDGRHLLVGGQVRWILVGDLEAHVAGDEVTVQGAPVLIRPDDPIEEPVEPTLKVTSIRPT